MSSHRFSPTRRLRFVGAGLLVLALWVQALAPVAALRAMSAAVDPLRNAIICGHGLDADDAGAVKEPPDPHGPACALCQLCCAGIATPILPEVPFVSGNLRWRVVSWSIPPPIGPSLISRYAGQPRAPPISA